MTEVDQIKNLIERDWTPTISGRSTDVPDPDQDEIRWVLEKEERDAHLRKQDVGYVTSGADTTYTPQGVGWSSEQVETAVVIEYRAVTRSHPSSYDNGYHRLFGKPTGPDGVGAADRWDGITNETRRVILDNRTRTGGWTRIGTDSTGAALEVRDLGDLGGNKYYRADVWIPMDALDDPIDTST